jgi:hypothetical protein
MCAFAAVGASPPVAAVLSPLTFVTAVWLVLDPDYIAAELGSASSHSSAEVMAGLLVGAIIAVALYGAIVAAIYKTMVRDFDMIVRRQSR